MDERKKYQVSLGSVLDCQMDGFDHTVVFDEFTQAKDFALDAFQGVIDRLSALCEQIGEAESYEDLDLGWWEPLFEEIEGDNQSSEETRQTIESKEGVSTLGTVTVIRFVQMLDDIHLQSQEELP